MNNTQMTVEQIAQLQAQIAELTAKNAELMSKKKAAPTPSLKVSEKGAVSLYGLGRFPITLYPNQWKNVLGLASKIEAFIEENKAVLQFEKPAKVTTVKQAA